MTEIISYAVLVLLSGLVGGTIIVLPSYLLYRRARKERIEQEAREKASLKRLMWMYSRKK